MRIGSLFSGYGGLEQGVQAVLGGSTAWVSDIDKGACKILAHRYPDAPNLGDISKVDWSQVEPVDVLTGGFPCQDVSLSRQAPRDEARHPIRPLDPDGLRDRPTAPGSRRGRERERSTQCRSA
jgi:site-specific DNA-cytosine methylase